MIRRLSEFMYASSACYDGHQQTAGIVFRQWSLRLLCAGLLLLAYCDARADESARPNIVLIMADDLGIEGLEQYGGTSYRTPNLNRLADEGMRFTHAYSQPLCTPTRVQLMTGKYNHRNWFAFGLLDSKERTFGHLLKQAGYRTCIAGKWQLQSYDPPDFPHADLRRGLGMKVFEAGFEEYCLFHSWHTEQKGSRYANPTFDRNGMLITEQVGKYGPDVYVQFLLDFLKVHREEPVLLYYPMALPHWPMVPTPDSKVWQEPTRRLEESTTYFPDMVEYLDRIVGRLVGGIDELGLQRQTLILFYSDNGTDQRIVSRMGEVEIRGGKATPLQTGIRVPLIARWTGTIPEQQECSDLIDASDFLPTLADLAGIKIPDTWPHDGVSFAPQLRGEQGPKRSACFFWYDPRPGWDKERFSRHIFALDHHYKLFDDGRFFDISGTDYREMELDPTELSPAAIQARKKLQRLIDQTMQPPISPAARTLVNAYGEPISE